MFDLYAPYLISPVQRTSNAEYILRGNVRIDHCRLEVLVAKQFLNRPDVVSILKEMGRRTVSACLTCQSSCPFAMWDKNCLLCSLVRRLDRGSLRKA
jgi:hypothetical protein